MVCTKLRLLPHMGKRPAPPDLSTLFIFYLVFIDLKKFQSSKTKKKIITIMAVDNHDKFRGHCFEISKVDNRGST